MTPQKTSLPAADSTESGSGRILIIDDEKNMRESLAEYVALDGYSAEGAGDGETGLALLLREVYRAVILDLRMPGMDGLAVLAKIRESGVSVPVLMMSAHGDISDAVEAMKRGAADYLVKPFDPAELVLRMRKAIGSADLERLATVGKRLATVGQRLAAGLDAPAAPTAVSIGNASPDSGWISVDPSMLAIRRMVERVAGTSSTVLVTGESGTGKEVVARELHRLSRRSSGPFVPVNVGAVPESLLESELFGHEKGSFTGADARKTGLFELASGGTLFLDELGEMPAQTQVKLLRVLQDRTVMRVGGTRPIPIDVRIIAATNKDIEHAVATGTFREDLYFRLNVIRLRLPPLRARPGDIAPLTALFVEKYSREMGKPVKGISPEALDLLRTYPFPGNVRELENSIERAVILCENGLIVPADLALEHVSAAQDSGALSASERGGSMRDAEHRAILDALERNGWHRERTAGELGITRRTLLNKMKEYGINAPR